MAAVKKNIVVHDYGGYIFIYQLAKQLGLEHNVTFLYSSGSGSTKGNVYHNSEGLICIDLNNKPINKSNFITRLFVEIKYGKILLKYISSKQVDVILSANTPVIPQYLLQQYCRKNKIRFIFWLQDIISLAVKSVLEKKSKIIASFIYRIWKYFERKALRNSDRVVVISEDFTDFLRSWKIDNNKIECIPNWSSVTDIVPKEKINKFSKTQNISDTFNVIYSGTLGYKHNPDIIYEAAAKLNSISDINFIVISEGIGAHRLKELNSNQKLENLILLPYQSHSLLSEVLASADVILSILEQTAGIFSVPSKVWTGYCAGRASLLIVPKNNLAAKITAKINAGVVIDFDDADNLTNILLYLKNNPDILKEYGRNARSYAEEHFDILSICSKFNKMILID